MPATGYTLDQIKAQLVSPWVWRDASGGSPAMAISFGFPASRSWLPSDAAEVAGWSAFNATQASLARQAVSLWDDVVAATFTEFTGADAANADIRFSNSSAPDYAYTYYPGYVGDDSTKDEKLSGSIWLDPRFSELSTPVVGRYGFFTLLHEIGHAIGLSHPGEYDGEANYATDAVYVEDTWQYSVMSYFEATFSGASFRGQSGVIYDPQTPMLHDIAAIQSIYGVDTSTRTGDTVYGFNGNAGGVFDFAVNRQPVLTLWDAGGRDTLDLSGFSASATVNLGQGAFSSVNGMKANIAIAFGADIENATGGAGNDAITGNGLDNTLRGLAGSDRLDGLGGSDWLDGGAGTDTLFGGDGDDFLVFDTLDLFDGGSGRDTLVFNDTLSRVAFGGWNIEQATLTTRSVIGSGWTATTAYFDTAWSRTFEETVFVDGTVQQTDWDVGGLYDWTERVRLYDVNGALVSETFTADGVSSEGKALAGPDDIAISNSRVKENAANGTVVGALSAAGGSGGPYTFVLIDDAGGRFALAGQQLVVKAGGLLDFETTAAHAVMLRSIDAAGAAYEETITVSLDDVTGVVRSGTSRSNALTGTGEADTLNGLSGNDTLNGLAGNDTLNGGRGYDTMSGGAGNDQYVVDSSRDRVNELAGQGSDTVTSSVSWTLGANLENLTLTGSVSISGTGNALDNTITGNAGANVLAGGDGNDRLLGGAGNDTISGDGGSDWLAGGAGLDSLRGGAEADTFVFAFNSGRDVVADFEAGIDKVGLEALTFGIDSLVFEADIAADSAAATILYDFGMGQLLFDMDGSGAGAATAIAAFANKPVLTVGDFILV
jgi:serralysin